MPLAEDPARPMAGRARGEETGMTIKATSRQQRLGALGTLVVSALALVALAAPAAHAAASVTTTNSRIDVVNFALPVNDCVNGGSGEMVVFNGTIHRVTAVRIDAQGGLHVTVQNNLAGMIGVGQTSGDVYHVTNTAGSFGERLEFYAPPGSSPAFPREGTVNGTVRYVSSGSGDNLTLVLRGHITISANGDVTVDNMTLEQVCNG
jgi:hypothetical protein